MRFTMVQIIASAFLICFTSCEAVSPAYRVEGSLVVDGRARTYLLNFPPAYYEASSDFPLVVALHGTGGSAMQCERDYRLTEKANQANFMIVYPEGVEVNGNGILGIRTWNAGTCCDYARQQQIDDVKFISHLIDELTTLYKVNPKKVYVTGMSNGAMLAYRLACEIPHKIAAIASVSGTMLIESPCTPSASVPILHIHSLLDKKVPYQGGIGLGGYYFPPVDSVLNVWAHLNACTPSAQVITDNSSYKHTKWSCKEDVVIESYVTKDGGHAWPGGLISRAGADKPSAAIDATRLIWDFFQRFELK